MTISAPNMKANLEKQVSVVVVIPAYNEEATIKDVVREARKHASTVIVCDDGSTDMTSRIARELGATVISHNKNLGKGAALRTLFKKAREVGADMLVTLDADGQHDAQEIPRLVEAMKISAADIVVGSRFTKTGANNSDIPIYRALGNRIISILVDRRLTDTQSGFRVYNKAAFASLMPRDNGMGADSEILIRAKEMGLKVAETPVSVKYDVPKSSKHNVIYQVTQVVLSAFRHSPATEPKFLFSVHAILALLVTFGSWIYFFQMFLETRELVAYLMLIAIGSTVISAILLSIAIKLSRPPRARTEETITKE